MKHPVKIFSPAAPDFGGLHGRFADLYARRETPRWHHTAAIVLGAVAGVAAAWVLT
jgi:hypothetical protein